LSRNTEAGACGLSLRVEPTTLVLRPNETPSVTAHLTNDGERPLSLVFPGDGSYTGLRTPIIEWTFVHGGTIRGSGFCGNINALRRGEVFILGPGETRELPAGLRFLALPTTGSFRAAMTYSNDPALPFRGVPLGPHDEAELARLRASARCRITSNPIEIQIEGEPYGR
jgi:hypothetical protein